MDADKLRNILTQHKKWLMSSGVEGERVNLMEADLRKADMQNATLDFSCWPLWCGSKQVKVNIKLVRQLLAHVACLDCADKEFAKTKKAIMPYAKKSHRVRELGIIK